MKISVVGASGYIGRALSAALIAAGHTVSGVVRPGSEGKLPAGAHAVHGDVSDPASLANAAREADAVVYAVQYNGADAFEVESAALKALAGALGSGEKTLVYTSGIWLYGSNYPAVADETAPHDPPPIVGKRAELEAIVFDAGLRGIVIRPGCVYGAGGGIPAMWAQSARTEGAARMVGDGSNHWIMVHLDDLATLYVHAIEQAPPKGDVYNASDDTRLTVREMAQAASRGQGKDGAVIAWPAAEARAALGTAFADALLLDQAATSAKARRDLGWHPRSTTAADDLQGGSYVGG
jgi:nucleoside-diphosphate-sugar epimerase